MSLMSLRRKLASRRTTQTILWSLVVVFLVGIALWSVPPSGRGGGAGDSADGRVDGKTVLATINGKSFTATELEREYEKLLADPVQKASRDYETGPGMRSKIFLNALRKIIVDATVRELGVRLNSFTLRDAAKEYAELQIADTKETVKTKMKEEKEKAKTPAEKKKLKSFDVMLAEEYGTFIKSVSPDTKIAKLDDKKFTNWFVNKYLLDRGPSGLYTRFEEHIRIRKIGEAYAKMLPVNPLGDAFVEKMFTKEAKASWIFIAAETNDKSAMDKAKKKAEDLRAELLKNPADFMEKAKANTDDDMTKTNGGDLGWVAGGGERLPFMAEYLAYTTKPGTIGDVVSVSVQSYFGSKTGYAFAKVDEVRDRKEADENWKKDKKRAAIMFRQRCENDLGEHYLFLKRAEAKIDCKSHELAVYLAEDNKEYLNADTARKAAYDAYHAKLRETNERVHLYPPEVAAAFAYRLSMAEVDLERRAEFVEEAAQYVPAMSMSSTFYELGTLYADISANYAKSGKAAEAKDFRQKALKNYNSATLSAAETDRQTRENVREQYKKLNHPDGVAEMTEWLKAHPETESPASSEMSSP